MSLWDKSRRFLAGLLLPGLLLLPGCARKPVQEAPALREPRGVSMGVVEVRRGWCCPGSGS